MSILVIADLSGSALNREATAKAINAVRGLDKVSVLVAGYQVAQPAAEVAALEGVARVLVADQAWLAPRLAEDMADIIATLAPGFTHVVAATSASSRSYLPRAAALCDRMVIGDVTRIVDRATFERPIYAGNALEVVESLETGIFLTIRPTSFSASLGVQPPAPIEPLAVEQGAVQTIWISDSVRSDDRPDLATAPIVVSGGRGVGSAEGFQLVVQLADRLGAAVGASRAAVDAGYAASDLQVGQTGKVVAPRLYIAVGISGAIQHVAGMKDSQTVVVINSDTDAPINQIADYVWSTDLFTALPDLIAAL
jgi:electron transfer flavoprotein alpha subunit